MLNSDTASSSSTEDLFSNDILRVKQALSEGNICPDAQEPKEKNTALHHAVIADEPAIITLLLANHARTDLKNIDGLTSLELAEKKRHWKAVKVLLEEEHKRQDSNPEVYGQLLLGAIAARESVVAKMLIISGAELNRTTYPDQDSSLHLAVKNKQIEILRLLLGAGIELDKQNIHGLTAAELAADKGQWDYVKKIVNWAKKNNKNQPHLDKILAKALKANQTDAAKALFEAGAKLKPDNKQGKNSVLHDAVLNKNLEMILLLLEHGASTTAKNKEGRTPVDLAASKKFWKAVIAIAEKIPEDDKHQTGYGRALLKAVRENQLDAAKALLTANAELSWITTADRNGLLHHAVLNQNSDMIALLLKHGVSITAKNKEGRTSIQLAAYKKYWTAVIAIAENSSEDDQHESNYGEALLTAVQENKIKVVKTLLTANATLTWHTRDNKSHLLHYAVLNDNSEMIALLLRYGASTTVKNKEGKTPIQLAAELGHWGAVLAIDSHLQKNKPVKQASDNALIHAISTKNEAVATALIHTDKNTIWTRDADNNTALHHAVITKNLKLIALLVSRGADVDAVNNNQETAVELAAGMKDKNLLHALADHSGLNAKWILNRPAPYTLIMLLLRNQLLSAEELKELAKTKSVRKKLLRWIETQPSEQQQVILRQALNENTSTGQFFAYKSKFGQSMTKKIESKLKKIPSVVPSQQQSYKPELLDKSASDEKTPLADKTEADEVSPESSIKLFEESWATMSKRIRAITVEQSTTATEQHSQQESQAGANLINFDSSVPSADEEDAPLTQFPKVPDNALKDNLNKQTETTMLMALLS